jgi:hypothetical protein
MKKRRMSHCVNSRRKHLLFYVLLVLKLLLVTQVVGQNSASTGIAFNESKAEKTQKLFGGKITNKGFGGPVLKFSNFNGRFALMTGGRGAITINNRFTIGGGGFGIANTIKMPDSDNDTSRYFKMGYGGIEAGYFIFPGRKMNVGGSMLVAAGATFLQNKPKNNRDKFFGDNLKIFPAIEPSLYCEIVINRFMRLDAGMSYRFIKFTKLAYQSDLNKSGLSCYVGLLLGKP